MRHSIDGLHAEIIGNGPLVVLVHGTAPSVWGEVPALLAASGRTVLTYWRRSYPPSDTAKVASLRQHADDLATLIDANGGHAAIVGWSIGGVIALDLAARHPERIDELVLLEAAFHLARHPTPAMLRAVIGSRLRGKRDAPAGARQFLTWALGRTDGNTDVVRLDPGALASCGPAIVAELALGTGEKELASSDLAAVATRVQWLVGTESRPSFAKAARRASRILPLVSVTRVPRAGHALQLDAPEAVVAALANERRVRS